MTKRPFSNDVEGYVYRTLMHEIKRRLAAIDVALRGELPLEQPKFSEEFCYLQLRMICELIAFGCLVIHGSLGPRRELYRSHKADWIMGELEKLHEDFFPIPVDSKDDPEGIDLILKTGPAYITPEELRTLWNRECGNKLHRGSAEKVLTNAKNLDLNRVLEWRNKIGALLEHHIIATPDTNSVLELVMNDGTGTVSSRTIFHQPPEGAPPKKWGRRIGSTQQARKDRGR